MLLDCFEAPKLLKLPALITEAIRERAQPE